jgi:hypothetical protein
MILETMDDPRTWLMDEHGRFGLCYCPQTRFVGLYAAEAGQWTLHGPHADFDHAAEWMKEAAPELDLTDETMEVWKARIEQMQQVTH